TEILRDFRSYRPADHSRWLEHVDQQARSLRLQAFARADPNSAGMQAKLCLMSSVLYLDMLDGVREFRDRHWRFTKEYILKHTKHPVATGGSPIVTWLPNQLSTVLRTIEQTAKEIDAKRLGQERRDLLDAIKKRAETETRMLAREVEILRQQYPN